MSTTTNASSRRHPVRALLLLLAGAALALLAVANPFGCRLLAPLSRVAGAPEGDAHGTEHVVYFCPMHPDYTSDRPGLCPVCSMKLVPLESGEPVPATGAATMEAPKVRIAPERRQLFGIEVAPVTLSRATVELRAVGRVAFDETRTTHVHPRTAGFVENVFVDFVGAPVRKGQPLFSLYSPELVASQQELLAALRFRDAMASSGSPQAAGSASALVEAARARALRFGMTEGQVAALEASGHVTRAFTVVAPAGGVVTARAAYHHGMAVAPEDELFTIMDASRAWILASVYEDDLAHVRVGQRAEVRLAGHADAPPREAVVTFIAPRVDLAARTVDVRMEIPNEDLALLPGAFVDVVLEDDLGERLLVPKSAVMDTGAARYVFVDLGEGYLEPRAVETGPEAREGHVIASGLSPGERVVVAANFVVDAESRMKGALEGMGARQGHAGHAGAGAP